jgi:hypothetical protein
MKPTMRISVIDCFSHGFTAFKNQAWTIIASFIIIYLIQYAIDFLDISTHGKLIQLLINFFLVIPLIIGFSYMGLKASRNLEITLSDLLTSFSFYKPILLATCIVAIFMSFFGVLSLGLAIATQAFFPNFVQSISPFIFLFTNNELIFLINIFFYFFLLILGFRLMFYELAIIDQNKKAQDAITFSILITKHQALQVIFYLFCANILSSPTWLVYYAKIKYTQDGDVIFLALRILGELSIVFFIGPWLGTSFSTLYDNLVHTSEKCPLPNLLSID